MIQALSILKYLVCGDSVPAKYADCIQIGSDYAELEFTFDLRYPDAEHSCRTVIYSFKMESIPNDPDSEEYSLGLISKYYPYKIRVFDETITAAGTFSGVHQKKQVILTAKEAAYPIGPGRKLSSYVGKIKKKLHWISRYQKKWLHISARHFFSVMKLLRSSINTLIHQIIIV